MTVATFMLKGDALLSFVNDNEESLKRGELTRTEMIKDAGYVYDNGKAMYVDFYTELLRAKGITPVTDTDVETSTYDSLSSEQQELYDVVDSKLGEKWDHETVMDFIEELDAIGIETAEQFDEYYEGCFDNEKEFAEHWVTDVLSAEIPECVYNCIDWDHVWSYELRYDFITIDFDYSTYIFRNN